MSATSPTKKQLVAAILVLGLVKVEHRHKGERAAAQQCSDMEAKLRQRLQKFDQLKEHEKRVKRVRKAIATAINQDIQKDIIV